MLKDGIFITKYNFSNCTVSTLSYLTLEAESHPLIRVLDSIPGTFHTTLGIAVMNFSVCRIWHL